MPMRLLVPAIVFALTAGAVVVAPSTPAQAVACETQINKALADMSVPKEDVKSIKVTRRAKGAKSGSNYDLDAWIRLNSCSGYVMVLMRNTCHVQDTYTAGNCNVSGMPNY
ncbi:hypothetical protein [Pelagibius sp.]|uniref:hypothetical protein n=1 Tax=Pelagibius sp. TaxID=1931238 RepID=UPI0026148724|nr:hypothetical protein [Pelagibius sp.]